MATAPTHRDPAAPALAPATEPGLARGSVLGRYVLLELLGEGGMGTVFVAHDGALDRSVAIKIVRREAGREAQARLVQEAKTMARVQHPAIVTVHDVGAVGARVYVAMELVRGTTLRGWLDAEARAWPDVVRAFVAAGRGLAAAHAAGVVHRDFKPENVLVDAAGRVRVTDFGLAAIVAGETGDAAPLSAGTPVYMSPEQYARRATDARTDQFSFCVALWDAVYDEHPFGDGLDELRAAVLAGAVRPATARAPAWLADVLRRGLAVDPDARYPDMDALLDALERRLAPPRRRALWPFAVAGVAVAALLGLAVTRRSAGPTCDDGGAQVRAVWDATRRPRLLRVDPKAIAALDGYARAWTEHRTETCRATHERGEQSGELLDLRMQCLDRRLAEFTALADALAEPGATASAQAAAESLVPLTACDDVATLREVVQPPADPRVRARVEAVRAKLATIKADFDTGRFARGFAAADALVREADAIGYPPLIAEAEFARGQLAWRTERLDLAETSLYRAIATGEAGRAGDVTAQAWLELLWFVSQERKLLPEAQRLGRLAKGAVERYAGDPGLQSALDERLGVIALDLGDLTTAAPLLQRAYDARRAHFGDEHPYVAASLQHLALLASARGDHAAAIERHRRALGVFERTLGANHPDTLIATNDLGAELLLVEQYDEALQLFARGLAGVPADGVDAAGYHHNIALIEERRGRHAEAIAAQRQALAILERVRGADAPDTVDQRVDVARSLRSAGRYAEAVAAYRAALPSVVRAYGADGRDLAVTLEGLGRALIGARQPAAAQRELRRALAIFERLGDRDLLARTRDALAEATGHAP